MASPEPSHLVIKDSRFLRFEAIQWWDQSRLKNARILVVGAGALGNEIIKNLALLGIGQLVIVDRDSIELSNLSRSVLFRESNKGLPKALCAANAAKDIYPDIHCAGITGNVLTDVGIGFFRRAQVIIGALDNREARVFVNKVCALLGKPWIDGGIEVLSGIVRGFAPPATACYECTMSKVDWDMLNKSRSCSLLAKRAQAHNGVATTPTTASIIGAIQAQETVKILHGMDSLLGKGFFYDGAGHNSYYISYPIKTDCTLHEPAVAVETLPEISSDSPVRDLWEHAGRLLGGVDAIDLCREIVSELTCPSCARVEKVYTQAESISKENLLCKKCGVECTPGFFHSISGKDELLNMRIRDLGLPKWDVVWARFRDKCIGLEITGDAPDAGELYPDYKNKTE